jgi:hypothetical protein
VSGYLSIAVVFILASTINDFGSNTLSSFLQSPGGIVSKDSLRNKKRVVKLVTIVTVMFSLSWLPIQLILLLKSLQLYPVTILNISVQVTTHKAYK